MRGSVVASVGVDDRRRPRSKVSETVKHISQLLLPIWIVYAVVWVAYWGYTAAVGSIDTSMAVSMTLSGITGVLGLLTGWSLRRR